MMVKKIKSVAKLSLKRVLPSPTVMADKLRELDGNMAAVARFYGVTRQAVSKVVRAHPSLHAVCHDARESMKDDAESALYKAIRAGEAWAVCFYLKTQAKDRGYIERQEHEHTGETRIIIVEAIVEDAHQVHPVTPSPAAISA